MIEVDILEGALSHGGELLSKEAVERIRKAYGASSALVHGDTSAIWNMISGKNRPLHDALTSGVDCASFLDNPGSNHSFYGFDNLYLEFTNDAKASKLHRANHAQAFYQSLGTLAEAVGAKRTWNPEGGAAFLPGLKPPLKPVEELIGSIEEAIGIALDFPNPFPDECGLPTSRGVVSQRAVHAIYQAWRLKCLSHYHGRKILEVGAGLGRTAYYARKMGLTSYTIVDIPLTNVAQADFLLRTIGEDHVSLFGEAESPNSETRIVPPGWLQASNENFDIILNVDSMTEIDGRTAHDYADLIVKRCKVFLSINHEANEETVVGLAPLKNRLIARGPYIMRAGYMEELFSGDRMWADFYESGSWRATAALRWARQLFAHRKA